MTHILAAIGAFVFVLPLATRYIIGLDRQFSTRDALYGALAYGLAWAFLAAVGAALLAYAVVK